MKHSRAHLFISNPDALKWLEAVVNYISASFTNPELWDVIKQVEQEGVNRVHVNLAAKAAQAGKTAEEYHAENIEEAIISSEFVQPERFVSMEFFLHLSAALEKKGMGEDAGGELHVVGEAFQLLTDHNILTIPYAVADRDLYRGQKPFHRNQPYFINEQLTKELISQGVIYDYLFGFDYIRRKYTNSVVKIEVKSGEDIDLGTGWLFDWMPVKPGQPPTRLVITNDHVLAGATTIKVLDKDDRAMPHHAKELLLGKTGVDVAILIVDYNASIPAFALNDEVPILEEIITMGYPRVPLSSEAYQLVHKGEVNARVTDCFGQDLLIISARTAPGNSGSPVIDDSGRVVGMVTEELFEKKTFEQKGITPYSACIPTLPLLQALTGSDTVQRLLSAS